ncbi:MAG: HD domain-containing protein [Paludibacteraceae bacterium]|nr:HD domain-containing protein [Paludibacteraceae bacterium]
MEYAAIQRFVAHELSKDHSGHNHQHAERVVGNAKKILQKEGGNEKIILTAAWLHDCIDKKLFTNIAEQLNKVERFLEEQGFLPDEVAEVMYIIQNISYNKGENRPLTSLNAMIVRDADRLDAIGAIGIIRTIEYGATQGRLFYDNENIKREGGKVGWNHSTDTSLSHFYDKLLKLESLMHTPTAKAMAKERTEFLGNFLKEFYRELDD